MQKSELCLRRVQEEVFTSLPFIKIPVVPNSQPRGTRPMRPYIHEFPGPDLHADSFGKSELCLDRVQKCFWLLAALALFLSFSKGSKSPVHPQCGLCAAYVSIFLIT